MTRLKYCTAVSCNGIKAIERGSKLKDLTFLDTVTLYYVFLPHFHSFHNLMNNVREREIGIKAFLGNIKV